MQHDNYIALLPSSVVMSFEPSLDVYLDALQAGKVDLGKLVLRALEQPHRCAFRELQSGLKEILSLLQSTPPLESIIFEWSYKFVKAHAAHSIRRLASKDNPWHFGAIHTTPQKLRSFKIEEMACQIEETAPEVWELVGIMLGFGGEECSIDDDETGAHSCFDPP